VPADRQSSRPWIGPVIGVVLVLTAVGGLVARSVYQPTANASTPPSAASPPSTDVTTSGTPAVQPGSSQVKLSADAALSPYGAAVQSLLQTYYNAINGGNYPDWESTVAPELIQQFPQQSWASAFKSTRDGSMYVYRINAAPGNQLRLLITFTSTQDLDRAPQNFRFTCIGWSTVTTLVNTRSGWKVDNNPAGTHPLMTQCVR
jgi:hypothetical protein